MFCCPPPKKINQSDALQLDYFKNVVDMTWPTVCMQQWLRPSIPTVNAPQCFGLRNTCNLAGASSFFVSRFVVLMLSTNYHFKAIFLVWYPVHRCSYMITWLKSAFQNYFENFGDEASGLDVVKNVISGENETCLQVIKQARRNPLILRNCF